MALIDKQLYIHLSASFCEVYRIKEHRKSAIFNLNFDKQKEHQIQELLVEQFKSNGIDLSEEEDVVVSYASNYVTLIPNPVFDVANLKAYMNLCHASLDETIEIDYNRVIEASLVVVYAIPLWIKKFFILKNPKANIQHLHAHQIRGLFSSSNTEIATLVFDHEVYVYFMKGEQLHYTNVFEYQHVDDILYFLSLIVQQFELEKTPFTLNFVFKNENMLQELEKGLKNLTIFSQAKVNFQATKLDLNLQLCV